MTSSSCITYTYDGNGKRLKKTGGKLYWYGAGSNVMAESDLSGTLTDEYVFFDGKRIARRIVSSNTIQFYFADHLGTSRVVASATGTILDDSDFYPFGGERVVTSSSGNAYKFTGKERDGESGLDFFGARYYASAYGRFMSSDNPKFSEKANPQTWNLYTYVSNNPLSRIDPTGNNWFNINGEWKWFEGNTHTYVDAKGKRHTVKSNYTHLLVIQKSGQPPNSQGATAVTLTLYDQDKEVIKGKGFTGSSGNISVPDGTYEINLNNRGGLDTNRIVQTANGLEFGAFHNGIQEIGKYVSFRDGTYDPTEQWGTLRANFSRGGRGTHFYLHGKGNNIDGTLGCVMERDQKVLGMIFRIDPSGVGEGDKSGRIAVAVTRSK